MAHDEQPDRRMGIGLGHRAERLCGRSYDLGCPGLPVCGDPRERCPDVFHMCIVGAMPLDPLLQELREAPEPVLRLRTELPRPEPTSVALLSGSFDPLTIAHAALAEAALGHADLVLLVYSVRTLPKEGPTPEPLLSEAERLAVLEAFSEARPGIEPALSSHGLLAEQVQAARARFPSSDLALVMGSDKVRQVLDQTWYQDRRRALQVLFSEARILYAVRTGDQGVVEDLLRTGENARWKDRFVRLDVPSDLATVSAGLIRKRLAAGGDVAQLVPIEAMSLLEGRRATS
jgi:nicotinate-nucleotide adenylyltransferase